MNKGSLLLTGACGLILGACNPLMTQPNPEPEIIPENLTVEETMVNTPLVFNLTEQNDLGQTGTLTLTQNPDGTTTTAVLAMMGGDFIDPQPAHIHEGRCPNPGNVMFPLTNVMNGQSMTTLDMSVIEILTAAPQLAVNVHKSTSEPGVYTACADLN